MANENEHIIRVTSDSGNNERSHNRRAEDRNPAINETPSENRNGNGPTPTDNPGSNEGTVEEAEAKRLKEAVGNPEWGKVSALYHRAVQEFDENDKEVQLAEHYKYNDAEYNEHGFM